MFDPKSPPRLSATTIAGAMAPPYAEVLVGPAVSAAMKIMHRKHARVFERLGEYESRTFLIDPTDLPFAFLLEPKSDKPKITTAAANITIEADTTIRGPLVALIALLEGRVDGDALFFSRDLVMEGDIEAALALRDAVDGEGIDLAKDSAALFGPLAPIANQAGGVATRAAKHFAGRAEILSTSLLAPLDKRSQSNKRRMKELQTRIDELEHRLARKKVRP